MKYLLDTHAFLWSAFSPEKLTARARSEIQNPQNAIYVSAVTFWEVSLKYAIGKLELEGVLPGELPDIACGMGFLLLPLCPHKASSFHILPRRANRDPFDRMLVWLAIKEEMVLISGDAMMRDYRGNGLKLLWD